MATSRPILPESNHVRQWVSRILRFSSEYNSTSWSASTIIGAPRVYPQYGDLHGAWASKVIDGNQFVEVGFEEKIYITEINIYETYHAGGTKRIRARNPNNEWITIYETPKCQKICKSRIFSPDIQKLEFPTDELRVDIDCTASGTWVEIDAVEIVGTRFNFDLPALPSDLATDFKQLVKSQLFSDVTFDVEGKLFHGHKAILTVRSEFFRAMFCDKMRESTSEEPVKLNDISPAAFEVMLHFIYTNNIPEQTSCPLMVEVWRIADLYVLDGLKSLAIIHVSSNLNVENVVDIYLEASNKLPIIEELVNSSMSFMTLKMSEIVHQPNFTNLPKDTMVEIVQHMTEKLSISRNKKK